MLSFGLKKPTSENAADTTFNYYQSVHHPIPTHENREHPGKFQNKLICSAFN